MFYSGWISFMQQETQSSAGFDRKLLRRVFGYALRYKFRLVALLGTIMGITILSLVSPLLYRALIDQALPNNDAALLDRLAIGMILVPLLAAILRVTQDWLTAQIGNGIVGDLRVALFAHLQKMSLRFFTNTHTGELLSRLSTDVVGAQNAITGTLSTFTSNVLSVTATIAVMMVIEWRLTVLAVLVVPCFIIPARRMSRIVREVAKKQMTYSAEMNTLMSETLSVSGALLVKLFGRASDENVRMRERVYAVRDGNIRRTLITRSFFLSLSLIGSVGAALVFWLGGHMALSGTFSTGTVVALGFYLAQLYNPLMEMTNARMELAAALVSFERVFEVLDLVPEVADKANALRLKSVKGSIRFANVSFAYLEEGDKELGSQTWNGLREASRFAPGTDARTLFASYHARKEVDIGTVGKPVQSKSHFALRDITFDVLPGQLVALVGRSGSGKSTLTSLLPRLYDVISGTISIDGHDVRDLMMESLSNNIGMVTQESYLFHDTILANLRYAKPDATQAEIEAACRAANIHDVIMCLPSEYDTLVGERGYKLSGGEKQRLAIARVLLKDPRILILDEATSSLDSETELLIQQALHRLMLGRTSIVIAHRLSTIMAADQILMMQEGRIIEQGTHQELLLHGGVYERLYKVQFAGAHADKDMLSIPDLASIVR